MKFNKIKIKNPFVVVGRSWTTKTNEFRKPNFTKKKKNKEIEQLNDELEHLKVANALQELEILVLKTIIDDLKGENKNG